ncbi:hypothetical protein [Lentisalinibacter salinarum]|uniref:hypothetical protein n=2 Tax=Lentisalinibacter salinarum TaxID=2992239 RepID=UPI00386F8776
MLEGLGNLGDFIGGIAVVVSLIYLAIQVRANTRAVQSSSRQQVAEQYRITNRLRLDPEKAEAFWEGLVYYPDMPIAKRHLFGGLMTEEALFFQSVFAMHESAQLEGETYEAYLRWFSSVVATPGGKHQWDDAIKPIFPRRMISAVEKYMGQGQLLELTTMFPPHRNSDLD